MINDYLVLDVETTRFKNKSQDPNPFSVENKLVLTGIRENNVNSFYDCVSVLSSDLHFKPSKTIVGFNLKFDLHWIRRAGITQFQDCLIWDCQLAEFILSNQTWKYPDLDTCLLKRGMVGKSKEVEEKYWNLGVDTDEIPLEVLTTYLSRDLEITEKLFQEQQKELTGNKLNLFKIQCQDLLMLEEMEWNGFLLDKDLIYNKSIELNQELIKLEEELRKNVGHIPINFNSDDHLSALFYGGTITEETRVPVGVYKTGLKSGQPRYSILKKEHRLPRMVNPIKGTELAKEGYWSTAEPVLRQLKDRTGFIKKLLRFKELSKLLNTYFTGIPQKLEDSNPFDGRIHGNLNQCVVVTGRLSATKPNQQNLDPSFKECLITEYD